MPSPRSRSKGIQLPKHEPVYALDREFLELTQELENHSFLVRRKEMPDGGRFSALVREGVGRQEQFETAFKLLETIVDQQQNGINLNSQCTALHQESLESEAIARSLEETARAIESEDHMKLRQSRALDWHRQSVLLALDEKKREVQRVVNKLNPPPPGDQQTASKIKEILQVIHFRIGTFTDRIDSLQKDVQGLAIHSVSTQPTQPSAVPQNDVNLETLQPVVSQRLTQARSQNPCVVTGEGSVEIRCPAVVDSSTDLKKLRDDAEHQSKRPQVFAPLVDRITSASPKQRIKLKGSPKPNSNSSVPATTSFALTPPARSSVSTTNTISSRAGQITP
eukprot:c6401_g1_i1.p1 GENE.c6401_g1_i1~~c6401_g1_i1.p1  ORF type:complete len:392 (-),score=69.25 c6401_g1_i1:79-1089(-)